MSHGKPVDMTTVVLQGSGLHRVESESAEESQYTGGTK